MKRNSRNKRQRPPAAAPREWVQGGSETRLLEPDALRELSRAELVALVLKLQARPAAAPEPAAEPPAAAEAAPAEEAVAAAAPPARPAGLVIDSSVRSGQTINFPEGDVTVIGSVGSGAEIVAGGSIHVYGTLRGRAIAGTSGDQTARIFCQDLDAELLSIDGRYRVAENFERTLRGRPGPGEARRAAHDAHPARRFLDAPGRGLGRGAGLRRQDPPRHRPGEAAHAVRGFAGRAPGRDGGELKVSCGPAVTARAAGAARRNFHAR